MRNVVDSDSFRQPVVRSGGGVRRPAAPPRRTPFPEVESLVALVLKFGGREGIRTPGLLIANEGNAKLRRGSAIT